MQKGMQKILFIEPPGKKWHFSWQAITRYQSEENAPKPLKEYVDDLSLPETIDLKVANFGQT